MKKPKKLKLKQKCLFDKINPIYNLEDEKVQRLNLDENIINQKNQNEDQQLNIKIKKHIEKKISEGFIKRKKKEEKLELSQLNVSSTNTTNVYNNFNEESFSLNKLNTSIEKLKILMPNINEKIKRDNSVNIYSHPRIYNKNYENYLNNILKDLKKQENELKQNKESLENELKNIEDEILDKQLNLELLKNNTFQKNVKDKMIQKYEKEYKENITKEILNNNKIKNIDKNALFSIKNKYKDEFDLKEQQIKRVQKLIDKKDFNSMLKEKAFKSKLNSLLSGNEMLSQTKIEQFKNEITNKKKDVKKLSEDLKKCQEKLKSLHNLQKKIKNNLYIHYLSILKEGTDTRDEGLAWIIAEILNLGKKVLMSYMPSYLDEKCILYLFLKAHLMLKIKYIEKKINETKKQYKQAGLLKKKHKKEISNIKAIQELNHLKETFMKNNSSNTNEKITNIENEKNSLNSTSIHNYKSSMVFLKEAKRRMSRASSMFSQGNPLYHFDEDEQTEIPNVIKFKDISKYSLKKHYNISFDEFIRYNNEIEKLNKLKEILKEEETKRIFEEFHRDKYLIKYNVDKNEVLQALIGEDNMINESFMQNKMEKQLNEELIKTKIYRKNYQIKNDMHMNNNSRYTNLNSFSKENENLNSFRISNISYNNNKE